MIGNYGPTHVTLAKNIRFGSFSLRLQRVERLIQAIFG
jgi:hypothetical protein